MKEIFDRFPTKFLVLIGSISLIAILVMMVVSFYEGRIFKIYGEDFGWANPAKIASLKEENHNLRSKYARAVKKESELEQQIQALSGDYKELQGQFDAKLKESQKYLIKLSNCSRKKQIGKFDETRDIVASQTWIEKDPFFSIKLLSFGALEPTDGSNIELYAKYTVEVNIPGSFPYERKVRAGDIIRFSESGKKYEMSIESTHVRLGYISVRVREV